MYIFFIICNFFAGIHWTFNGKTIHTLPDEPELIGNQSNSSDATMEGVQFDDQFSRIGLGVTSTLVIENFDKAFEGSYACNNGIESDSVENKVLCNLFSLVKILTITCDSTLRLSCC